MSIGSGTRPLPLTRPGHAGVYISKTGPQTNIIHTPAATTTADTKTQPQVYDASVMEPPNGAYSNAYPSPSATAYQNNYPSPSATSYRNNHVSSTQMSQSVNYKPQSSQNVNYKTQSSQNVNYKSHPSRRQQQVPQQRRVQQPQLSNSRAQTMQQRQQSGHAQNIPQMSQQMSYESMIDSKNAITGLVLQYMSSLPMDVAMETAAVECDGYARPVCKALPMWNNNRPFDEWCSVLCPTGVCPAAVCTCTCSQQNSQYQPNSSQYSHSQNNQQTMRCKSMSVWGDPSMDMWCSSTCNANPDNCPSDHCWCDGL